MKLFVVWILLVISAVNAAPGLSDHYSAPISFSHTAIAPAVVKSAPIVEYVASAPAAKSAPIVQYVASAPVIKAVAPAATSYATFSQVHVTHPQPVVKYAAAPVAISHAEPAPIVKYAATPSVHISAAPHITSDFGHSLDNGW